MTEISNIGFVCLVILMFALVNALFKDGFRDEGDGRLLERWHQTTSQFCTNHCLKHMEGCKQVMIDNDTCLFVSSKLILILL